MKQKINYHQHILRWPTKEFKQSSNNNHLNQRETKMAVQQANGISFSLTLSLSLFHASAHTSRGAVVFVSRTHL
jgi:hypothetical protein